MTPPTDVAQAIAINSKQRSNVRINQLLPATAAAAEYRPSEGESNEAASVGEDEDRVMPASIQERCEPHVNDATTQLVGTIRNHESASCSQETAPMHPARIGVHRWYSEVYGHDQLAARRLPEDVGRLERGPAVSFGG